MASGAFPTNGFIAPKVEDHGKASGGITHVFSSSYLSRLFKNPFSLSNVAPFKIRSPRSRTDRYTMPERPVTGRACANCFDATVLDQWEQPAGNDSADNKQQKLSKPHVCDVLQLPTAACNASYGFIKRMSDAVYCARVDTGRSHARVDADVLASEQVKEGIAKNVAQYADEEEDMLRPLSDADLAKPIKSGRNEILAAGERVRAKSIFRRMRAHVFGWVQKVAGYLLFKLLRLILRTVQVCPGQIEKLKKSSEDRVPIIYLPNHRSHLDYILLSFTVIQFGLRMPYVAAGDNLDIPLFSYLLRSLGAFFIKRRLDKDYVYRAVLQSYIEELLKNGESLEFFTEAGRSRTGRLILPKAGLLSIVVEAHLKGIMRDAHLVPVSISYEKLMEGGFSSELMGEPKKKETFFAAVKGIWNVFSTKYGSVRIDFGQPVSLKDHLSTLRNQLSPLPAADSALSTCSVLELWRRQQERRSKSLSSRNSLLSLCSGFDSSNVTDENRRLIKALCNHIAYDFSKNSALMCTQMLAFLLVTKYRRGGRLDDIVDDFHWLCRRVLANGHDVGFSGDPRDVVRYAIELLGPDLVTLEISDIDSGVVSDSGSGNGWNSIGVGARYERDAAESHMWLVKPTSTLPRVHVLTYYAAPVSMVFLQEAVVANALLSASLEASKANGQGDEALESSSSSMPSSKTTSKTDATIHSSKIIERAMAITDMLQHEFLFARPCVSLRQTLEKTLERMVQEGLLVRRACPSLSTPSSSSYGVRFCLDKNQTLFASSSSSTSSRRSSTSTMFGNFDDDMYPSALLERALRRRYTVPENNFFVASEDEELADYEDEVDEEEDDLFGKTFTASTSSLKRSSYGIASLVDSEDDYNADVIRLYASVLAPLLAAYKFALKMVLTDLSQPAAEGTLMRTQWKTEVEMVQKLLSTAKEVAKDSLCHYPEFVNIEPMRNAIKWLVLKGVLVSNYERLRLHDVYADDKETLERFRAELDDLCVVVTY